MITRRGVTRSLAGLSVLGASLSIPLSGLAGAAPHRPKLGDYTVNLNTAWAVDYRTLPSGTAVTLTYITTPGGCTNDEHNAQFTTSGYPWFYYNVTPLFTAKSSGSCGLYASYADYRLQVKFPDGYSEDDRLRIAEDGTSEKYSVDCVKVKMGCYPGGFGTNPAVTFRNT